MQRRSAFVLWVLAAACSPAPFLPDGGDATGGGQAGGAATGGGSGGGANAGGAGGGSPIRRIVSLAVTPAQLTLRPGAVAGLTCTATFDDATTADVSGTVQWDASPAGIADVSILSAADNLVRVEALAAGSTQVVARTGSLSAPPVTVTVSAGVDAGTPVRPEVRAVWVTRFAYNDAATVRRIMADAAAGGFNVVYFQIRGNGDAYYRSTIVPWAKKLSGVLGKDPGWDPLQVAIDEAHARGLQLHAYFNAFTAWPCSGAACTCSAQQGLSDSCVLPEASFAGAPEHWLRTHPESMVVNASGKTVDAEYFWFSAGDPAYRAHLIAAATELLTNYSVDGLHLDRIRYPGTWASYDPASQAAYAALPAPKPTHDDWQRDNVSTAVAGLYDAVKQRRPNAVLSASVWGIYKRLPGCNTSEGFSQYFQDSVAWMKTAKIDAITPMIYWDIGSGCTDWAKLLDGFMAGATGRPVIAGMHAREGGMPGPRADRLSARVAYARQVGAAGTSVFASTYLDEPPSGATSGNSWGVLRANGGVYAADAGTPPIDWR